MASGTTPKYADGNDTGWVDTEISFASGTLYYRRIGSMCELSGDGVRLSSELAAGGSVNLGTLPASACPTGQRAFFPANCLRGYGFFVLGTNGVLTLYNTGSNSYRGGTSGDRIFVGSIYF